MQYTVSKLNVNKLYDGSVIFIFGDPASGKSWLIKDLLWHKQHMLHGTIVAGKQAIFYNDFAPNVNAHTNCDSTILSNCIQRQTDLRKYNLDQKERHGHEYKTLDRRSFIVIDDCTNDTNWINDKYFRSIIMLSRSFELMPIVALETCKKLPPIVYCNIDYIFVFRTDDIVERRRIHTKFMSSFTSFEVFCQLMDKHTTDYECLVIYNGSRTYKLEDSIFWYKAESHPDWRVANSEDKNFV
jgi:hypothetical protein